MESPTNTSTDHPKVDSPEGNIPPENDRNYNNELVQAAAVVLQVSVLTPKRRYNNILLLLKDNVNIMI